MRLGLRAIRLALENAALLARSRVRRTHLHPCFKVRNHRVRQLFLGRHLEIRIEIANGFDEQTLLRVARLDRRSRRPAFECRNFGIKRQAALDLVTFGTVALVTILDERRPNLAFKKFRLFSRQRLIWFSGKTCDSRLDGSQYHRS